jgi:hypothetical protein
MDTTNNSRRISAPPPRPKSDKRKPRRNGHHRPHTSQQTLHRRPAHNLSPTLITRAKELRDDGASFEEIADRLGSPVRDVELALMNSRSPNPDSDAACIYTNRSTLDRFLRHAEPSETRHETLIWLLQLADRYGHQMGR